MTGPRGTSVVCADPAFSATSPEDYPFLVVRDLFDRHGIRVPALLGMARERGLLLLEDCGDLMLQDEIPQLDRDRLAARYREIIDILVRIQSIRPGSESTDATIPFSLCFDHEKLMFEFDIVIEHGLETFRPDL